MTDWHCGWTTKADFNRWQVEDLPVYAVPEGAAPLDRVGERLVPRRVDGFVLRNELMHCSIAHRYFEHDVWATAIGNMAGPWGPLLSEPVAYGGNATSEAPAHDFVLELDGELLPAPLWRMRRARRLRHAPVVNTVAQAVPLELSSIDFAPSAPDLPVICRAVRVRNASPVPRRVAVRCYIGLQDMVTRHCQLFSPHGLPGRHSLGYNRAAPDGEGGLVFESESRVLLVATDPPAGQVAIGGQGQPVWDAKAPPVAIEAVRNPADGFVRVELGELAPGEAKQFCLYLATGPDPTAAREILAEARSRGPERLLQSTVAHWQKEREGARFATSDPRLTDLIDALRDTVVQMSRRPHGHIRVGYYYNRAILKCGAHQRAGDNLSQVIENWRLGGITNEYHSFGATSYWYDHAEIPQLLTMLVKDYHDWTGDDAMLTEARPLVEDCMAFLALTDRGLQILSGDETYRYCTVTDPWAENADNSFAAVCCLEWAARVWPEHLQDYAPLAACIRAAIDRHLVLPEGRYAHYVTANGWRDERPIADIMLRPLLLGYASPRDAVVRRSVEDVWRYNRLPDGTITTDPVFYQSGQGACLMLQSLAEFDSSVASEYFWSFVDAAPATGGWWEYTDNQDTTKSGGRLLGPEPLPSALEGLLHYLFGHKPVAGGLEVAPHLPQGLDWARVEGFALHGRRYDLSVKPNAMSLSCEGQELLSANRPLRARVTGHCLEAWPIIPTPPYPDVAPARLSWQDGWQVTPCPALGDVCLVFSLPGQALRYEQSCDGRGVTVMLTNLGERACTCQVLGQTRQLAAQERWCLALPIAAEGTISWAVLSPYQQRLEEVEPGAGFALQGRVSRNDGAPWRGELAISGAQEACVELDALGCFSAALAAPSEPGTHTYCLATHGVGMPEVEFALRVSENPLARLDEILGNLTPGAALVIGNEPAARGAALWIWQEILNIKQLSLPIHGTPLPAGETLNLLVVGSDVAPRLSAPLVRGEGYAIHRNPWNPQRYLIHVPLSEDHDVRRMAHGLVQTLQLHTRRPARQYRRPQPNEGIAIYEFNACHRDWQTASLFGRRPWQPLQVEIEAGSAQACIGGLLVTRASLSLQDIGQVGEMSAPYVRVQTFSTHPFTTTVAVECDADELHPVRVRLRAPLGVRLVWIPDISYYWVTGLSPTCHYDGTEEVARVWRESDGSQVIEISLRPGEPIRPVLRYPAQGWTPTYPATYRRMEAVFTCLAPVSFCSSTDRIPSPPAQDG